VLAWSEAGDLVTPFSRLWAADNCKLCGRKPDGTLPAGRTSRGLGQWIICSFGRAFSRSLTPASGPPCRRGLTFGGWSSASDAPARRRQYRECARRRGLVAVAGSSDVSPLRRRWPAWSRETGVNGLTRHPNSWSLLPAEVDHLIIFSASAISPRMAAIRLSPSSDRGSSCARSRHLRR